MLVVTDINTKPNNHEHDEWGFHFNITKGNIFFVSRDRNNFVLLDHIDSKVQDPYR